MLLFHSQTRTAPSGLVQRSSGVRQLSDRNRNRNPNSNPNPNPDPDLNPYLNLKANPNPQANPNPTSVSCPDPNPSPNPHPTQTFTLTQTPNPRPNPNPTWRWVASHIRHLSVPSSDTKRSGLKGKLRAATTSLLQKPSNTRIVRCHNSEFKCHV